MFRRRVEQPADPSLRTCTLCRQTKPMVGGFHPTNPKTQNFKTYGCLMPCIECSQARCRGRTRSKEQRERDAERKRLPEEREKDRQRHRAWHATDAGRQYVREHCAKRYATRRAEILAEQRRRYRDDPEVRARVSADTKRRRQTPEGRASHQLSNWRRKLAMRGVPAKLTRAEWLAILEYFDHRCAYCLRKLSRPTQEHVQALSRGGTHTADNIVPACQSCNSRKNDRGVLVMVAA